MRIISHRKIREFYEQPGHEDSRVALQRWYDIAERASWSTLADIRSDFPATDYVGNQHYVFNILGNNFKYMTKI